MKRTRNEGTCIKEIPFGQSLALKCLGGGTRQNESGERAGGKMSRAILRNLDVILRAMERIRGTFSRGIISVNQFLGLDTFR